MRRMESMVRGRQREIQLGIGGALGAELEQRRTVWLVGRLHGRRRLMRGMPVRESVRERHLLRNEQHKRQQQMKDGTWHGHSEEVMQPF